MRSRKDRILPGLACAAVLGLPAMMAACSSAPVKMECSELQARLNYSDLSDDQRRFAEEELAECQGRVKAAEAKDSAAVEGLNNRFTPKDSN